MNKLAISALLFLAVSTTVRGECDYQNTSDCEKDSQCYWSNDPKCNNQESNCSSYDQSQCAQNTLCSVVDAKPAHCEKQSFGCKNKDRQGCLNDFRYCGYLGYKKCTTKDINIPACDALPFNECSQETKYCRINGECKDNSGFCNGLNKMECELFSDKCSYDIFEKEQCVENPLVCPSKKSKDECLEDSSCQFEIEKLWTCTNKLECSALSKDECSQNNHICNINQTMPFGCKNKGDPCFESMDESTCNANPNCKFTQSSQTCEYKNDCSTYSESECKLNDSVCEAVLPTYECSNKLDCSTIPNENFCQFSNDVCQFTPTQGKCQTSEQCSGMSKNECIANNNCRHIPAGASCNQKKDFGCANHHASDCFDTIGCTLENYSCGQRELADCNELNYSQCIKQGHCKTYDAGDCFDRPMTCPSDKEKCSKTKFCEWQNDKPISCKNKNNCPILSDSECNLKTGCFLTQGGCRKRV